MNDNHKTGHDVVYKYGVSEEQVMVRRVDADSAYFKRNLPAVIYDVYHAVDPAYPYTHVWERTGTNYTWNKRVAVYS